MPGRELLRRIGTGAGRINAHRQIRALGRRHERAIVGTVTHPLREGRLIAYVGDDDPEHDLFNGQPGVVIDVRPTANDISVALPAAELALIDIDQYRLRSARMRAHEHPIRDEVITRLHIEDPLESEHD